MARRWKLRQEFMSGGDIWLGGHRPGEPPRVKLTAEDPYVEGDEYRIYDGTVLREVKPLPSVEDKKDALSALKAASDAGSPIPTAKPSKAAEKDEDEDEGDALEVLKVEPADTPEPPEPEELVLDSDFESEEDEINLPTLEELEEMTRSELERLATQLGVLDDIDGSGSGGYVTVPDFQNYLAGLLG